MTVFDDLCLIDDLRSQANAQLPPASPVPERKGDAAQQGQKRSSWFRKAAAIVVAAGLTASASSSATARQAEDAPSSLGVESGFPVPPGVSPSANLAEMFGRRKFINGTTLRLQPNADDTFFLVARVNGTIDLPFVVDTGSFDVVLSPAEADRLHIDRSKFTSDTAISAAGDTVIQRFVLDRIQIGACTFTNVSASVGDVHKGVGLFGMSALKRFKDVRLSADTMTLSCGEQRPEQQRHNAELPPPVPL
jgi:clan AA aspartic protease (TIGR02281 family)